MMHDVVPSPTSLLRDPEYEVMRWDRIPRRLRPCAEYMFHSIYVFYVSLDCVGSFVRDSCGPVALKRQ